MSDEPVENNSPELAAASLKKEERNCANCGCSIIVTHGQDKTQSQMFCRLNPPIHGQARVEVQRVDIKGNKVWKDGKAVMNSEIQSVFVHSPTVAQMVCFDGWRPQGTLPGDFAYKNAAEIDGIVARWQGAMKRLQDDVAMDSLVRDLPSPGA